MRFLNLTNKHLIILMFFLLAFITIITSFRGVTDFGDYGGTAKFFAGESAIKLRTSHTVMYGLLHAPLLILFPTFTILKVANLVWLFLLILSTYYISGNDRRVLLFLLFSPIIWYMGPYVGPIQLAALLFLWGFFFLLKYQHTKRTFHFIISGILVGAAAMFWNSALFMIAFLLICFFIDKKVYEGALYLVCIGIGLLPLIIVDTLWYSVPGYSLLKFMASTASFALFGGIYGTGFIGSARNFIAFLLLFPFFIYKLFTKESYYLHKRKTLFIGLTLLFLLTNPQPRYLLFIWPLIALHLPRLLSLKQQKTQLIIFACISLLVILPYLIQINKTTNSPEWSTLISNVPSITTNPLDDDSDLYRLITEHPDETFIVGNALDDYEKLDWVYWGNQVHEFVSIQDYNLVMNNVTTIWEKKVIFSPVIAERREIFLAGGVNKNSNDKTDYSSIIYAIGLGEPIKLPGFEQIDVYGDLYLSKKISS